LDTQNAIMDSSQPGKPQQKDGLDLRIRLDSRGQFIGLSINEIPVDVPITVESQDCHSKEEQVDASVHAHQSAVMQDGTDNAPKTSQQRSETFLLELLRNSVLTLFAVITLQLLVHSLYLKQDESFMDRYGWWILYLDVSVVALVATLGYLRSYIYVNANHMVGMMIGMTIGMQVGTMIGGVLGATNGFFVGSIVGMTLGSLYGVVTAWCCGPMAVMHGLMAGVMGGTMGAMVVVMMIPDHVLIFMPIFTTVNLLILIWFTYLFYKECVLAERCQVNKPIRLSNMIGITLLTVGFLTALMIIGPKGPMVWKGQKRTAVGDQPTANPFSIKDGSKPGNPDQDMSPGTEMACGAMKIP